MKFSVLLAAVALLAFTPALRAEDAPPPPTENPPAAPGKPAPPAADAPKPGAARKEEEANEGLFSNLFGQRSRKKAAAATAENDGLHTQLTAATDRIAELEAANQSLTAQMGQFNSEWPAIEAALASGDSKAPALQTPFGQKVSAAVSKSVTHSLTQSGHEPGKLPGPGADKPDTGKDKAPTEMREGPAKHIAAHWADKAWTQPGLN